MADLDVKQGEAKTVEITIRDEDGNTIDVTTAVFTFSFQERNTSGATVYTIPNADITKTDPSNGVITLTLTTAHTATVGDYRAELKTHFTATNIDLNGTTYTSTGAGANDTIDFTGAVDLDAAGLVTITSGGAAGDDVTVTGSVDGPQAVDFVKANQQTSIITV